MADERQQPEVETTSDEESIMNSPHALPYRRAPEFRVIYANSVRFATAPWDFSLVFGQTIVDTLDDVHIEDRVTVTLSPQTAKAVADFLNKNLADYERQYGEIRYTPLQPQPDKSSPPQQSADHAVPVRSRRRFKLNSDDKQA